MSQDYTRGKIMAETMQNEMGAAGLTDPIDSSDPFNRWMLRIIWTLIPLAILCGVLGHG